MAKQIRSYKRSICEAKGLPRYSRGWGKSIPKRSARAKMRARLRTGKRTSRLAQMFRRLSPMPTLESKLNVLGVIKERLPFGLMRY